MPGADPAVDPLLLAEGFRRAQMAGRAFPIVIDFPSFLSDETVESVYLPSIAARQRARAVGAASYSPVYVATYPEPDDATCTPTWAGDAIAGELLLEEMRHASLTR